MHRFDEELKSLEQRIGELEHLRLRQKDLQQELRELETKVRTLRMALRAEEQDVEQLESLTLAAFFQWITGRKEEALDREKAEARTAARRYQEAKTDLESCEAELRQVARQLRQEPDPGPRYAELLAQKQKELLASGHPAAAQLQATERTLSRLAFMGRNIRDALDAGRAALNQAQDIRQILDDTQYIGSAGTASRTNPHAQDRNGRMSQAWNQMKQLRVLVGRFNRELSHVHPVTEDGDGALQFSERSYPPLEFDFSTRFLVSTSRKLLDNVTEQLQSTMTALNDTRQTIEREQHRLDTELKQLVQTSQ